jgi:hypothetical protein
MDDDYRARVVNSACYAVFVALGAFSPLIGAVIAATVGRPVSFKWAIAFMWVGLAPSLPASLALARAFGRGQLESYWLFLESFPKSAPRKRLIFLWSCLSLVLLLVGVAARFVS